ncbi:glycosyltransferase family 4 protein [Clostridium akagii]|uniref:glycosyltransferase family 4 protein n=1 Tax=Clostridium akagii TaxID=91623 RepID=UPI0004789DA5|nr:glycosyltransferase [Clostridium akagii]
MRYCVLYPNAENVHLIKDVGMIAYKLHKLYEYDAFVASYNNGEYEYLNNEVKGLKQEFIDKKHGHFLNVFLYLRNNAVKIDVLQIFHMTFNSVVYAAIYKLFNKKGTIFLKLDCTEAILGKIKAMGFIERLFFNFFLSRVDIIGVEQKKIYENLKALLNKHSSKLLNVPNGIDYEMKCFNEKSDFSTRENTILSVGRIGSPEKVSDLLLKAFASLDEKVRAHWKVVFIGPVEENFQNTIDDFYNKNKGIKGNVIFKGPIYNREELYMEYKNAKIFCLTSSFESVGIALIEAASCGDVILSTRVGIAEELTALENGITVNVGDEKALAEGLSKLILSENLKTFSQVTEKLCKEEYNWDTIVKKLEYRINKLKGNN